MSFQPRIFTFYSYKGGVGRSMALLNMAYYLHARGRHVLIVDLDLDAPGASGFLHRTGELQAGQNTGDVVDVLAAVVRSVRDTPSGAEPPLPPLRLEAFMQSVDPGKYAPAVHPRAPRARLDVLVADQTRDYTARLSALELSSLSANQIAQTSDLLRGVLLNHTFPFFQPWQEEGALPEDTRYDYILVDSRTGLSEIGGLCVGPLSDRLIVLCGLNDQNINGTRHFLEIVGLQPKPRPADEEQWDDADPPAEGGLRPATLGPKPTLLVASPVPGGEMTYKRQRMEVLEKEIGLKPVKLSYHPQMALMETIFVRDFEDEYLALEYAALAERVMGMVGDTAQQLLAPLSRLANRRRGGDESNLDIATLPRRLARSSLASGRTQFVSPFYGTDPMGLSPDIQSQIRRVRINLAPTNELAAQEWLQWADAMDTPEARRTGDSAVLQAMEDKYRKAVALKIDFHEAFYNWGIALSDWAEIKHGAEAEALFTQAGEKYQQALAIKPDSHEAFYNWGNALSAWAEFKQGAEAEALFAQAGEKYQQALAIKSDSHDALHNWGAALAGWASIKQGEEAEALFSQAGEKCQQALAIKSDSHDALHNWGAALAGWARIKQEEEAEALFSQAGEKYQKALAIKPDKHEALNNWGIALSDWAKVKHGAEAEALFSQAGEKYQQALAIKPDHHTALNNWGNALAGLAKVKHGAEAESLFSQAGEKYQQALAIKTDFHEALNNWGIALSDWAKVKHGAEAESLITQAGEKYQQALAMKPDYHSPMFNLACLAGLRGNADEAVRWLEKWRPLDPQPNKAKLDNDTDFDKIRNDPGFQALRDSLPG